jgi:beta-lactam-binding protein with PASTA domain
VWADKNKNKFRIILSISVSFLVVAAILIGYYIYSNKVKISKFRDDTEVSASKSAELVKVRVPDIVGKSLDLVKNEAKNYNIEVLSYEFDDTIPDGCIISQTPGGGQAVLPGFTVAVNVSKGKETKILPEISGLSLAEASSLLSNLKLFPVEKRILDSEFPENTVIGYNDFSPGDSVRYGAKIVILVSS